MVLMAIQQARAKEVRREMDDLSIVILRHIDEHPDDFDAREELWMRREELRAELHDLKRATSVGQRLIVRLFGRFHAPTAFAGYSVAVFLEHLTT